MLMLRRAGDGAGAGAGEEAVAKVGGGTVAGQLRIQRRVLQPEQIILSEEFSRMLETRPCRELLRRRIEKAAHCNTAKINGYYVTVGITLQSKRRTRCTPELHIICTAQQKCTCSVLEA